jgi:opacity protein-like surface antigen
VRKPGLLGLLLATVVAATCSAGTAPAAAAKKETFVELYANVSAGSSSDFQALDANGQLSETPFELPAGRVLVVTDVIVTPNVTEGLYEGNVDSTGGNENRIRFRFDSNDQAMLHLSLSSGLEFATPPQAFSFASNPGACVVRLIGTLKKGK